MHSYVTPADDAPRGFGAHFWPPLHGIGTPGSVRRANRARRKLEEIIDFGVIFDAYLHGKRTPGCVFSTVF